MNRITLTLFLVFCGFLANLHAESRSREKTRDELVEQLERKYKGKAVLSWDIELYQLDGLVRFFDFDKFQTEMRPSQLDPTYFEDYLAHPEALATLPVEIQRRLTDGLRKSGPANLAPLGVMLSEMAASPAPVPQLLDAGGNPIRSNSAPVIASPTLPPEFTTHFLGGLTGITGGFILPNSPLLNPDYGRLKERWMEYLAMMSPEEKGYFLRLELLPKRTKSIIVIENLGEPIQLKADLPEYERSVLKNLNWTPDGDALEFRPSVPYTSVKEYVDNLYGFAELAGISDLLENPQERKARSETFHMHAMAADPEIRKTLARFRRNLKDDASSEERRLYGYQVEEYLNTVEDTSGEDHEDAEWVRQKLIEGRARVELALLERDSGRVFEKDRFARWDSLAHLEKRAHAEAPEKVLTWLLPAMTLPAEEANRFLANEIQSGLTPEVAAHLARVRPNNFLELINLTQSLANSPRVTLETIDWHWFDGLTAQKFTNLTELKKFGIWSPEAERRVNEYRENAVIPGRREAHHFLEAYEQQHRGGEDLLSEWINPDSVAELITSENYPDRYWSETYLDRYWNKANDLAPEAAERYRQKIGEALSHWLVQNRERIPNLLVLAARRYGYLTEAGKREFAAHAEEVPFTVYPLLQRLRLYPEAFDDPTIADMAVKYLSPRADARGTVSSFVERIPTTGPVTPAMVRIAARAFQGENWDVQRFMETFGVISHHPAAHEFLEILSDEIEANRSLVLRTAQIHGQGELVRFMGDPRSSSPHCRRDWAQYGQVL